jgi:L-amino acid N-acyltransferase YncA
MIDWLPPKPVSTAFAVERWRDIRAEMLPLLVKHWREIALNHADVPLDIDEKRYADMDAAETLHIVTARKAGDLIGYHVAIISTHLHYASTLHGFTDVYYVAPEHRAGRTGLRLFQAVERELQAERAARGHKVMKLFTATKNHLNQSRLLEHLGYTSTEQLFTKIIRE